MLPFYKSKDKKFTLLLGDCIETMDRFDYEFDMIFADPPYFLSNDGITVYAGKVTSVNKGEWDRSLGAKQDFAFNREWLKRCREKLKPDGTIWVSGTYHNIFSIAQILNELDFKILNCVTWAKTNPPPNLTCRYFTHSSEFVLWARKEKKKLHYFNYDLMKTMNGGKQMRDVWTLPAIASWEKTCGKHPTQKPLCLLFRIILSCTKENGWILDPFAGSSTTGIAANLLERNFLGIDNNETFLALSRSRKLEIEQLSKYGELKNKVYRQLLQSPFN